MTVQPQPDYLIRASSPAPADYPTAPVPDSFSDQPFLPDYESRRMAFFDNILRNPAPTNTKTAWHELARQAAGGTPHEGIFQAALDFINARKDCADFVLHGILRLLLGRQQGVESGTPAVDYQLSEQLFAHAHQSVLDFKYFPNEPGIDSLCTWTENHYILYSYWFYRQL